MLAKGRDGFLASLHPCCLQSRSWNQKTPVGGRQWARWKGANPGVREFYVGSSIKLSIKLTSLSLRFSHLHDRNLMVGAPRVVRMGKQAETNPAVPLPGVEARETLIQVPRGLWVVESMVTTRGSPLGDTDYKTSGGLQAMPCSSWKQSR